MGTSNEMKLKYAFDRDRWYLLIEMRYASMVSPLACLSILGYILYYTILYYAYTMLCYTPIILYYTIPLFFCQFLKMID
jgi:hypothetical protein